jgi:hypothetical protein
MNRIYFCKTSSKRSGAKGIYVLVRIDLRMSLDFGLISKIGGCRSFQRKYLSL